MLQDIMHDIWENYRGRFLCTVFGLFIGCLFIVVGFWQTLFLIICVLGGFFIGYKIDKKENLLEWLDRLLPPGYRR